jgi:MYXO-CTERM domain-containing protein
MGGSGISIGGSLSVGGASVVTGAGGSAVTTGAGGTTSIGDRSSADPGCACALGSRTHRYGAVAGLLLLGALGLRRRKAA